MMRTEARQLQLPVSSAVAYDFLVDYRNDMLWRPEIKAVELRSGTAGECGALFDAILEWYGQQVPHELELAECERPSLIRVTSESPNMRIEVRYLFDDQGDCCQLTAEYCLDMEASLAILEPFAWALLMGWVKDDLPRLPEVLAKTPLTEFSRFGA